MEHRNVQKWTLIVIGALVAVIIFQVAFKLIRNSAKVPETVVQVSAVTVQPSDIVEKTAAEGVASGDPEVKVYSMVPGKFERAAANEGSSVSKDDPIVYIDRDIPGMDFMLAPVKSPVNGIVKKIYYSDRGASVSPQYPVAEVTNPDDIKVVLQEGEEEMAGIKAGMEAEISPAYGGGAPIKARVYSRTPFIDTDTMSGTIIVKGANPDRRIKPGMSVNVSIFTGARKAIMIPSTALLMGDGKTYVFINDNGKAKRADIVTGYSEGDMIEAASGLTQGAQVITEGNFKLNEGSRIEIK